MRFAATSCARCSSTFCQPGAWRTLTDDAEKNRLCRPIHYWDAPWDCLSAYLARMAHDRACAGDPALTAWAQTTRLNPMSGLGPYRDHPLVVKAWDDLKQYGGKAASNLVAMLQSDT